MGRRDGSRLWPLLVSFVSVTFGQTMVAQGWNGSTIGCPAWDTDTGYLTAVYYVTSVPSPTVSLAYSGAAGTFLWTVNGTYVPEYARYVTGYSPFAAGTASSLTKPGTCDNNDGYFATASFYSWWKHLPNAVGLATDQSATYPINYHNGNWSIAPFGCSRQVLSVNTTYAALRDCKDYAGNPLISVGVDRTGTIYANGTLYVTLVAPSNYANGESFGYMVKSWPYPFRINFGTRVVTMG